LINPRHIGYTANRIEVVTAGTSAEKKKRQSFLGHQLRFVSCGKRGAELHLTALIPEINRRGGGKKSRST